MCNRLQIDSQDGERDRSRSTNQQSVLLLLEPAVSPEKMTGSGGLAIRLNQNREGVHNRDSERREAEIMKEEHAHKDRFLCVCLLFAKSNQKTKEKPRESEIESGERRDETWSR